MSDMEVPFSIAESGIVGQLAVCSDEESRLILMMLALTAPHALRAALRKLRTGVD